MVGRPAARVIHSRWSGCEDPLLQTWKWAFYARDLAGTVVMVGVPTPDMTLEMPLIDFFSHGER